MRLFLNWLKDPTLTTEDGKLFQEGEFIAINPGCWLSKLASVATKSVIQIRDKLCCTHA